MFNQHTRVFDNNALFEWMYKDNISYTLDDQNLITLCPDQEGYMPALVIPNEYDSADLKRLKECGAFHGRHLKSCYAENLKTVKGMFDIQSATEINITALESVEIGLDVSHAKVLDAKSLVFVGYSIQAGSATYANLPSLTHVNNTINVDNATEADFRQLQKVGYDFYALKLTKLHAPNLSKIAGQADFSAVQDIDAPHLIIHGKVTASEKVQDYLADIYRKQSKEFTEPQPYSVKALQDLKNPRINSNIAILKNMMK